MECHYVDALVFGLGWVCCGYAYERSRAEQLEGTIRDESRAVYPGTAPRHTRIRTASGQIRRLGEKWEVLR